MRKFKGHPRHSLPFGLFLAVMGALLLLAALAPRANAADFSWTGVNAGGWNNNGNWSPLGPPGPGGIPPSSTKYSSISPISPLVLLSALCT